MISCQAHALCIFLANQHADVYWPIATVAPVNDSGRSLSCSQGAEDEAHRYK